MEKFRSALLKNKTFPLLTALLCAAAFAGGHMFVKYGYGLFNEIAQAEMVRNGLETGAAVESTASNTSDRRGDRDLLQVPAPVKEWCLLQNQ